MKTTQNIIVYAESSVGRIMQLNMELVSRQMPHIKIAFIIRLVKHFMPKKKSLESREKQSKNMPKSTECNLNRN